MNKLIRVVSFFVLCAFFTQPFSAAEAIERRAATAVSKHKAVKNRKAGHITPSAREARRSMVSWYGADFHGKRTASGQKFDMYAMTAAHKTLPLLSYAKVTNPKNNRSVIVRINDRGAFPGKREMDLSYAAAKKLGIHNQGIGSVVITPISRDQALAEMRHGGKADKRG
ncbi:septal ring lytic transglycosylase RlpA family protein [Methylobacter marinus]|uniref:septal ring lytic transglycosylase RlpA family protein n=1 Tax=Methylobacter marinus TaxID=34058 RepID=UPI0003799456|nr:septal ring lytic transglycosylase RlpA family protein [Methylobacter marinus]